MQKIILSFLLFLLLFMSCDKGCVDQKACNYGVTTEDCKYANNEESLLTGSWNLVDIHSPGGICLFSFSSDFDCELDPILEWVNIGFNEDKSCVIFTGPTNLSESLPVGNWSINICENLLLFSYPSEGYNPYLYPDYLPFGNQKIVQLTWNVFLSEDLAGNILRWEKI